MKNLILPLALMCLGCSSEAISKPPEVISADVEENYTCESELILDGVRLIMADLSDIDHLVDFAKVDMFLTIPIDNITNGGYDFDNNAIICRASFMDYPIDFYIETNSDIYVVMEQDDFDKFIYEITHIETDYD